MCQARRSTPSTRWISRFFEEVNEVVQEEPSRRRSIPETLGLLASIGIEKGQPFNPDAETRDILNAAAQEAKGWLDARYDAGYPHFYDGRQWAFPASPELSKTMATFYERPDVYSVDARGLADSLAYSTLKHLGAGQFYLMAAKDKDGAGLDGGQHLPGSTCRQTRRWQQYWSATLYDRGDTRAHPRSVHGPAAPRSRRDCRRIPTAPWTSTSVRRRRPAGTTNWVPTRAGGAVRSAVPPLRARQDVLRQEVAAAGHRDRQVIRGAIWHPQIHRAPRRSAGPTRRSCHRRQLQPRGDGQIFRGLRQARSAGQVLAFPRAAIDRHRQRAAEPRHALLARGVRPRCRPGDDHAPRRRKAVHVDDRDRRGSLRPRCGLRSGYLSPSPKSKSEREDVRRAAAG